MKTAIRHTICLAALFFISTISAAQVADDWAILPRPQEVHINKGRGVKAQDLQYIIAQDTEMPVLGQHLDKLVRVRCNGVGITLMLTDDGTPESAEGYILDISDKGVVIRARGNAGLFYGCGTLEQLLTESEESGRTIPAMQIVDYPTIEFRAVHFDTKHHLDRLEYYYRIIDRLAQWKVNAVIWEIEDKLRFERRPECASPNAISKQDMQALCRYAKERNVEINPLVQGLGHASFILKHHWELRENPASDWEFCPSNPATYDLQFDLYRDAIEAMPYGRYLHIGGDEITAIGIDERCRQTGKTPFELQMEWLRKVCDFAKANGRIPIFWDDMPLKYANLWWVLHGGLSNEEVDKNWKTDKLDEAVSMFPEDCIYMRWHYEDPTIYPHLKVLDWYRNAGLNVMGATAASYGESPYMPRQDSYAMNIQNFCKLTVENNLEGIFATSWDDGSPHLETVMRGYAALGEYGWNPYGRQTDEFKKAYAQREFGFRNGESDFLDELEQLAFFFDGALVSSGRRNPAWQVTDFTLLDLPEANNPGKWSREHAELLDSARMESARHLCIREGIAKAKQQARRNRYTLEIYEQNNELFGFPVHILLALEAFDKASSESERKDAINNISALCKEFETMRKNLEYVYAETRFMQAPNGYVADMNHHHHLAALTPNNDWMFVYELPFIAQIQGWLENLKTE